MTESKTTRRVLRMRNNKGMELMSKQSQAQPDKSFDTHVLNELKLLVSDLENGCEPLSIVLYEMVREKLWQPWLKETYHV